MKARGKIVYFVLIMTIVCSQLYGQDTLKLSSLFKPVIYTDTSHYQSLSLPKLRAEQMPLFCKWEALWSRNSGVNIRLRLGSLDYVNKLEGKK